MSGISPQQKKDPWKKEKKERKRKTEQGLNSKRGETSYEEAWCFKKERMKYKLLEEIPSKDRKEITFSIVKNPMCGLIHTHTSFAFALPSIPWHSPLLPTFTTPFSINHDSLPHKLSRIFLCFYNIQGVA
jgi:hypothetical protein